MDNGKITFSFGKNWEEFMRLNFSEERVRISKNHILDFLKLANMNEQYLLDVGCGSGLHSLAAFKAGAKRIVSFDIDPHAVKTTKKIKEMHGDPSNWNVLSGSILDKEFLSKLEPADIVYSWGVLHHTGEMWAAIENTARLVKNGGFLYIALYTTTAKSNYWLEVKKRYNRASETRKRIMEYWYIVRYTLIPYFFNLKNPWKTIREHKQKRGMAYLTDIKDWLGGYPYEDAKIEEVLQFCRMKLNLKLIDIKTGQANTEYLFRRGKST